MSLVAKSNITYQETATPLVKTNNVIMDGDGVISFTDPDGVVTLSDDKTVTGYRYFVGMPTQFNNGCIYDIGEISDETNLESIRFSAGGRLVQTCEVWFTTPATVPTKHKWPTGSYWIDSATGAAPTLIASKNYRLVFRNEPKKLIASIAYVY